MRVLLITGNHPRHFAFCNIVEKHIDISGHIMTMREEMLPQPPPGLQNSLVELWNLHFSNRAAAEEKFFYEHKELDFKAPTCAVPAGELNSSIVAEWYVAQEKFDLALIAGTEIIKEPLFSLLPEYKVNLHMGLIPEYKGSITMFWPFYLLEPQMAGCTYHVIDKRVDTGEILHQVVPELFADDGMHDVACRAYYTACMGVWKVLKHVHICLKDKILPIPDPTLAKRGKLFRKADWHPAMLRVIYELFDDRIVGAYLNGELASSAKRPKLLWLNSYGVMERST